MTGHAVGLLIGTLLPLAVIWITLPIALRSRGELCLWAVIVLRFGGLLWETWA